MLLSPHFGDEELGVINCPQNIIDNAVYLCLNILEPIRKHFGRPINIHDSYRDPSHNARVGGKKDSFHLFAGGRSAADFDVGGDSAPSYAQIFDWIRLQSKLPFDKVILEHNVAGENAAIHIQVDRDNSPRREAFVGGTGASQHYVLVETR